MPVKHHPSSPFVRRVPTWKMHIFTFVQVCALASFLIFTCLLLILMQLIFLFKQAMLWAVKSSKFSLAFPFFLILMVPIRHQMERLFTPLELRAVNYLKQIKKPFFIFNRFYLNQNSSMETNQTMAQKMNQTSTSKPHSQLKICSVCVKNLKLIKSSMKF